MKKRLLSLALAVLLLVTLVPVGVFAGSEANDTYTGENGITYTLKNGVLTVSGLEDANDQQPTHSHDFTTTYTPSTCTEKGILTDTCACGYSNTTYVGILGHNFQNGVCTRCGETNNIYTDDNGVTYTVNNDVLTISGEGECKAEWRLEYFADETVTKIVISSGITGIGYGTFYKCTSLTSIAIPDSITSIDSQAFLGCSSLTNIAIPASVTSVGSKAFYDCTSLTDVYYAGSQEQWNAISFGDCNGCFTDATIHFANSSHAHSYTDIVTAPTCTKQGYTTHTCSCGDSYADNYIAALGHDYADGVCTRCGAEDANEANLSGYEWSVLLLTNRTRLSLDRQPLTTTGFLQEACDIRAQELTQTYSHTRPDGTNCSTVLNDVSAPLSFSYELGENIAAGQTSPQMVVSAWINSPGHYANMISENYAHMGTGYSFSDDSFYGHYWVQFFFGNANCSHTSLELLDSVSLSFPLGTGIDEMQLTAKLTCSCCGTSYLPVMEELCSGFDPSKEGTQTVTLSCFGLQTEFTVTVEQHVHSYTDLATEPTCTEKGYTTHSCSCGDSYVDSYVDPLGHSTELKNARTATCTEAGYTGDEVCKTCGETVKAGAEIAALGHDYKNNICTRCGEAVSGSQAAAIGDINGDGTVNLLDLIRLKKYLAGADVELIGSADVNADGTVNLLDLIRLKKYLAGADVTLGPGTTPEPEPEPEPTPEPTPTPTPSESGLPSLGDTPTSENVLALLDKYDPDGAFILRKTGGDSFLIWFSRDLFDDLGTAVHEECHSYSHSDLFSGDLYYIGDGEGIMVANTETYKSEEMAAQIPEEYHTFRYDDYVAAGSELSSNLNGIYGLMNEFTAYCWGSNTDIALYDYFLTLPVTAENWKEYISIASGAYFAYAEFKYYILSYMLYAKDNYPEIYEELLANTELMNAFKIVEAKFASVVGEYFGNLDRLELLLAENGFTTKHEDGYFWIYSGYSGQGVGTNEDEYYLLVGAMEAPEYVEMYETMLAHAD